MQTRTLLRTQTTCLLILAAIASAAAIHLLKTVLVPFVLAAFLAIGLQPLVDRLVRGVSNRRFSLPHSLAVAITLLLAVVVLAGIGLLIAVSVQSMAANADSYLDQVEQLTNRFVGATGMDQTGLDAEAVWARLRAWITDKGSDVVVDTSSAVLGLVSQGLLVIIFLCFLLFGTTTRANPVSGLWGELIGDTRRYIATKFTVSAVTGTAVGLTLWLLGVQLAMVFGLLAFLLNFIPSIGSIIATLLPLPVVLLDAQLGPAATVLAIAIPGMIQMAIGNVIEPKIMGQQLGLHPVAVLLSLMFWGAIWGIVGMFLAVPITASARILMKRSELTAPVADILAGRIGMPDDIEPPLQQG
ncbi:MAG: AI-2E family transporter [Phycisphaerae bacterium]